MQRTIRTLFISITILFTSTICIAQCQMFENIQGYTPTTQSTQLTYFSWLAFKDGKVIATGTKSPTVDLSQCQKIDGKGQFMLPGLIDAHGHVSGLGNEMLRIKLRGVSSEADAVEKVRLFAQQNPSSQWLLGRGWNQVLWLNKQFPSKKSLDKLAIKRPVVLRRIDGHAAWVNSQALKIAGIDQSTPDPQGGKIVRDSNGEATGILIDNAIGLVEKKIPPLSILERQHAFDKAFSHLLSLGIVSAHDAGIGQNDLDTYINLSRSEKLPLRIYAMLDGSSPRLMGWLNDGIIQDNKDFLSVRSVKLYSDGALGSRGAALLAPYSDDVDNKGLLVTHPKKLDQLVAKILAKGFQANVHAIGDRGNRLVLDAYQKAFQKVGGKSLRNRVEHAQVVSLEDIPRFKQLDIIASMQPVHATSDKNMAGDRLGKKRLEGAYAWQKFIQQGTVIASGSDFPVELANAFHGLHAAVTRQDHDNNPKDGWLPGEKMTPAQALRSFTLDAAFAAHQEKNLGSLEKGKWADFILVDRDIIKGNPQDIWKTQVLQTWIGGKLRYQKN